MLNASTATVSRLAAGLSTDRRAILLQLALFWGFAALFLVSSLYDLSFGGVSTVGAERVLGGEVPYRDFWTMYAPGHFYLLAGIFWAFGTSLAVEVIAAAFFSGLAVAACHSLIRLLTGCSRLALVGSVIFALSLYNTGYFKRLSSYPPAILLIFVALYCLLLFFQKRQSIHLVLSAVATGLLVIFKHDVGFYTAAGASCGLVVAGLTQVGPRESLSILQPAKYIGTYLLIVVAILLPVVVPLAIAAGPQMVEDLVVFPLTDFRFSRPEGYPSLLPVGVFDSRAIMFANGMFHYLSFLFPFLLLLAGTVTLGAALARRKTAETPIAVTFIVAFLFHYSAAHVQINTHIVTMSAYAALLGALTYRTFSFEGGITPERRVFSRLVLLFVFLTWSTSLAAKPLYAFWTRTRTATTRLEIPKVAGFRSTPQEAEALEALYAFVNSNVAPTQKLFVGLHRHDVGIIGDLMSYFILDRPIATRYQEMHPAITDTAPVQAAMIRELRTGDVPIVILKRIFADAELDQAKAEFRRHLPQIGATDLDAFIQQNYRPVRDFGPYSVLLRNNAHRY